MILNNTLTSCIL